MDSLRAKIDHSYVDWSCRGEVEDFQPKDLADDSLGGIDSFTLSSKSIYGYIVLPSRAQHYNAFVHWRNL